MVRLQAIGNLGKDCALNTVNGKNVINFNVAHTDRFAAPGQQPKTLWIECAYWTDKTGIAPYLKKGTQVFVEGTPELRTYTNKEGKEVTNLSLRIMHVELLGKKQEGDMGGNNMGSYNAGGMQAAPAGSDMGNQIDDLPF